MSKWQIAIGAGALCFGLSTGAEPTPLVTALMNQPVTLFTLGMHRLDLDIDKNAKEAGFSYGNAMYDWDKNEIRLNAGVSHSSMYPSTALSQCGPTPSCEKLLREALGRFAAHYAMQDADGRWVQWVTGLFMQVGYSEKIGSRTEMQAAEELSRIVKFFAYVITADGNSVSCQRDLKAVTVYCATRPWPPTVKK